MSETTSNESITMSKRATKFVPDIKFPMPRPGLVKVLTRIPIKYLPYKRFKPEIDVVFRAEAAEKVQTMLNRLHGSLVSFTAISAEGVIQADVCINENYQRKALCHANKCFDRDYMSGYYVSNFLVLIAQHISVQLAIDVMRDLSNKKNYVWADNQTDFEDVLYSNGDAIFNILITKKS